MPWTAVSPSSAPLRNVRVGRARKHPRTPGCLSRRNPRPAWQVIARELETRTLMAQPCVSRAPDSRQQVVSRSSPPSSRRRDAGLEPDDVDSGVHQGSAAEPRQTGAEHDDIGVCSAARSHRHRARGSRPARPAHPVVYRPSVHRTRNDRAGGRVRGPPSGGQRFSSGSFAILAGLSWELSSGDRSPCVVVDPERSQG